jgi:molybdate transport system substrate-binding protein
MKLLRRISGLLVLLLLLPQQGKAEAMEMPAITVLADPSLSLVLPHLMREYNRTNPYVSLSVTFNASENQVRDIAEGEPGDLLITVNYDLVRQMRQQGLVDVYSLTSLMRNELILAGPAETERKVDITENTPLAALLKEWEPNLLLVMGDESRLFEGVLARQALGTLGALEELNPYISSLRNGWQMLAMIRTNGAYAILYRSAIAKATDIKTIGTFPASLHDPIVYYAMVVAGENMTESRRFLDYMKTPQAQAIFRNYGFVTD